MSDAISYVNNDISANRLVFFRKMWFNLAHVKKIFEPEVKKIKQVLTKKHEINLNKNTVNEFSGSA